MNTDKKIPLGILLKERHLKDFDKEHVKKVFTAAILSMVDKNLDWITVKGENIGVVNFISQFIAEEQLTAREVSGDWGGPSYSFYVSLSGHLPIVTAGIPKPDVFIKANGIIEVREEK